MKTRKSTQLHLCDGCRCDVLKGEQIAHETRTLDAVPGTTTRTGVPVTSVRIDLHFCATCAASPPQIVLDDVMAARRARWQIGRAS